MKTLDFDNKGNLTPALIHQVAHSDVDSFLVSSSYFRNNITRGLLWENLLIYNKELRDYIETGFRQWVCGSFCSTKMNPADIDIVCFLHPKVEQTAWIKDQTVSVPYFFTTETHGKARAWTKLFIDAHVVLYTTQKNIRYF